MEFFLRRWPKQQKVDGLQSADQSRNLQLQWTSIGASYFCGFRSSEIAPVHQSPGVVDYEIPVSKRNMEITPDSLCTETEALRQVRMIIPFRIGSTLARQSHQRQNYWELVKKKDENKVGIQYAD